MRIALLCLLCLELAILPDQGMAQSADKSSKKDTIPSVFLEQVVVTGVRLPEQMLRAASGTLLANASFLKHQPAPGFFDALEHLKGVHMINAGMGFRILNTRGFANTTNVRFVQLVDGLDVQAPHIGAPIGNALGPTDLDIDRVELVPGLSASLYGMNATNGLADIITKSPFEHRGLSIRQQTAWAATSASGSPFSETSIRYAAAWKDRLAFKVNAAYSTGKDWQANDLTDMNPNANSSTGLIGADQPGYDGVNSYGNESPNRKTLLLGGRRYVVSRTGYEEIDLTDQHFQVWKGDLTLAYRFGAGQQLQYRFKGALMDQAYQRANRFRMEDYRLTQHALQYQSGAVKANIYLNSENSGNAYNLRSMAEQLDRSHLSDQDWYTAYTGSFNESIAAQIPVAEAHRLARRQADAGRLRPGTEAFDQSMAKLQQINNWDSGAALKVRTAFVQADIQWSLSDSWLQKASKRHGFDLMVGADHRSYIIVPDGNYFINPNPGKTNERLLYGKTGAFLSYQQYALQKKLKIGLALRADKNDAFPVYWSPRMHVGYSLNYRHHLRAGWQVGYRFPSVFEAFSNVNSGGVRRVGGLPVMSSGIFESAWLQSSINAYQRAVLDDMNLRGLSQTEAVAANQQLLRRNPYTYLRPEQVRTLEAGYRGVWLKGRLLVDADIYFSRFSDFIAQANMNVPITDNPREIPEALLDRNRQKAYRMWTNAQTSVFQFGYGLSLTYMTPTGWRANAQVTHTQLTQREQQDGLEDGFNTPGWVAQAAISRNPSEGRFGYGLAWRWQDAFYWQSFLAEGTVPSFQTVDGYFSYSIPAWHSQIRVGANNMLNKPYRSYLGGPSIGGFYYLNLTFHLPSK